ncbi:hydroxyacylglutathione hydrolase [Gammaproteobacteria bacterium]|jgi:hydroxyacylglutathione hydrolase|nr:hydroxyacylglutathione hydrolase [Gammaproteobacteria bacterium]MDA9805185.1 hydroxyacylglutathione hydrolase [Gammaproteobacteria bacterium]MDC0466988.1 hydroxyacylglutathione hydrolase [Gammaproteobacteria bacterium]MDC3217151.1 hydroxyacylglutathione hydrolase [Gammaproteobacteria bacterium]
MVKIESIEAFTDNYIWLVTTNEGSIVIDPGESSNIINLVHKNQLDLKAILVTHHHFDHTGGIEEIISHCPVDVFGPFNNIQTIRKKLKGGDRLNVIGIEFEIIEIPGHTLDHIAFYSENNGRPILFCGDTLFAAGCGRVFEGTYEQMFESLIKLKNLPTNTNIYCGHEYTLSNLRFAKEVEPFNKDILSRYNKVLKLREKGTPSVPSTLSNELKTNPFLRCDNKEVQENISSKFKITKENKEIFKALRSWKDNF